MKTRTLFLVLPLLAASLSLKAQQTKDFQVPQNVKMEQASDYAKYEKDVLGAAEWLLKTPPGAEDAKRKAVSSFFFQWVSGAPNVAVEIKEYLTPVVTTSPNMMMIFMAGYVQHVLKTKKQDALSGNIAAVNSVLDYYQGNKGVEKTETLDQLLKLRQEGKLDAYIKEQL